MLKRKLVANLVDECQPENTHIKLKPVKNDRAVMLAYGFTHKDKDAASKWYTESETVAALMNMYQELTEK